MKTVNYEKSFGEVVFPEGFEELLKGKSIEKQMEYFRTSSRISHSNTGYGERISESGYRLLSDDEDVKSVIVRDGIMVGVMMSDDCGREVPCLPEERVCTYYDCDNNGAGYKERIDYTWLLCVPEGFEK